MLRDAVIKAMLAVDLSVKDAAIALAPPDATEAQCKAREVTLRKQLHGEPRHYLPFVQMACRWPVRFWLALTPALFMVWGQKRIAEFAESIADFRR
jgi:hypothetical protein